MTDGFLARWSKRKLAKGEPDEPEPAPQRPAQPPADPMTAEPPPASPQNVASAPLDLSQLPAIESIDANTDITGFLRPGVPAELTRAALRKAWTSDPAIRDFVGLVENGWDFNDPDAIPGFGRIDAGDAARLLAQALEALPHPNAETATPEPQPTTLTGEQKPLVTAPPSDRSVAAEDAGDREAGDAQGGANDAPQKDRA
jgi:hypothetical protein